MQRLRLAGKTLDETELAPVADPDPVAIALEVLADPRFALAKEAAGATEAKRIALVAAAPFVETSKEQLDVMLRGRGNCAGEDFATYFPVYPHEPAQGAGRVEERGLAERLCGGCPVRGQCIAFDYACVNRRVQHVWGIMGGLGARDRRELLVLWLELLARVTAGRLAQQNAPTDATPSAGGGQDGYQDVEVAS
jgi:hypothetical protein